MLKSPDAVLLYIPLIKGLGMRWEDIKSTPRHELVTLLGAYQEHERFHSMDGYTDADISEMAKTKPEIRSQYADYLQTRRKFNDMLGGKREKPTFRGLI